MENFKIHSNTNLGSDSDLIYHVLNKEDNLVDIYVISKQEHILKIEDQPFRCTKMTFSTKNTDIIDEFIYNNDIDCQHDYTIHREEVSLEDIANHLFSVTDNKQQLNDAFNHMYNTLDIVNHLSNHTFKKLEINKMNEGLIKYLLKNYSSDEQDGSKMIKNLKNISKKQDGVISEYIKQQTAFLHRLHDESEIPDEKWNEKVQKLLKHNNFENLLPHIDKEIFQNTLDKVINLKQFSHFEFTDDKLNHKDKIKILLESLASSSQFELTKQFGLKIQPLLSSYVSQQFHSLLEQKFEQEITNKNSINYKNYNRKIN